MHDILVLLYFPPPLPTETRHNLWFFLSGAPDLSLSASSDLTYPQNGEKAGTNDKGRLGLHGKHVGGEGDLLKLGL